MIPEDHMPELLGRFQVKAWGTMESVAVGCEPAVGSDDIAVFSGGGPRSPVASSGPLRCTCIDPVGATATTLR